MDHLEQHRLHLKIERVKPGALAGQELITFDKKYATCISKSFKFTFKSFVVTVQNIQNVPCPLWFAFMWETRRLTAGNIF